MTLVMVLLTIAVVAGVSAVVAGVVTGGLAEPAAPIPARALPTGPLTGPDVARLRFVQAFRGYRMDQVDEAMDRLAAEIDRLRSLLPEQAADPDRAAAPVPAAWEQSAATTGEQSVVMTGEQPVVMTGEQSAATTGEQPAATTGEQPAAELGRPTGRD